MQLRQAFDADAGKLTYPGLLGIDRSQRLAIELRDRAIADLESLEEKVEAAGGRAVAVRGDVSIETDVVAMFDTTRKAFGALDGLVNNAGIVAPAMPLAEIGAERLKRIFDVNVYGAYLCAREAARQEERR